ncbi:MAG: LysR substrate-binding domain-containing protein, partial [Candidatus Hydrogenedentales bacterium]
LNISQSALSEGLSDLEHALKTRLLVRRRAHGITLTSVGRELLEYARSTVHSAEALHAAAAGDKRSIAGTMTVGCYTTLAPFVFPPLIAALRSQHPNLRIEILEGSADEIQVELIRGRCELAFLYNFDVQAGVDHEVLYRVRPHLLMPGRHKLASRPVVDLRDLAGEPVILFDLPDSSRNTQMIFDDVGVVPNISIRSRNFELVRSLVGRGYGHSILIQRPRIQKSYEGNTVAIREIARIKTAFSVTLAYEKRIARTARLDAVRRICRACWPAG